MTTSRLIEALKADEDLVRVVRGHIYIEAELSRFIEGSLTYPNYLKESRLNWPARVDLALSLGLDAQLGPPLKNLGALRNRFAHRPDTENIGADDIDQLFSVVLDSARELIVDTYETMTGPLTFSGFGGFSTLGPKTKLVFIVGALHALLKKAADKRHLDVAMSAADERHLDVAMRAADERYFYVGIPLEKLAEKVIKYLKANPKRWNEAPLALMIEALEEACR